MNKKPNYFKDIVEGYRKIKDQEKERLMMNEYKNLEFKTTMYFIEKYVKEPCKILDAGGGTGVYSIALAKKGHRVTLLDITPDFLEIAKERMKKEKVKLELVQSSVTDLSMFDEESFDVVLCLGGVLSHVLDPCDRVKAVKELVRVLKTNGYLFISVIGRIGNIIKAIRYWPDEISTKQFEETVLTGDYDGSLGFVPVHFFYPEELEALLTEVPVKILDKVGLQGIVNGYEEEFIKLKEEYPESFEKLWKYHLFLCQRPSIVDTSEHFLFVSKKIKI